MAQNPKPHGTQGSQHAAFTKKLSTLGDCHTGEASNSQENVWSVQASRKAQQELTDVQVSTQRVHKTHHYLQITTRD